MIIEITFTKCSGAGNDFVVIDNRTNHLPEDKATLAQRLCSRHFGIGADGLLLLERSAVAHFSMRYYNSDGSHGGMCGNGGRCLAQFAYASGVAPRNMQFESLSFLYHADILPTGVRLRMKDPTNFRTISNLEPLPAFQEAFFIDTGSPHAVFFVRDVENTPVDQLGRTIREHELFAPGGTNVDFVEVIGDGIVELRTYERGVEAETLACGTGSVAAGVVCHLKKGMRFPVAVNVKGGETMVVNAEVENGQVRRPTLEGSAHMLYDGHLQYDDSVNEIVFEWRKGARI